jgi:hypothetical protein
MTELSLNILDIAQNSLTAGATLVEITVTETDETLTLTIRDNGCGMDAALLRRVVDPFSTTRKTRKVGMGLPLLKLAAEQTGGALRIDSVTRAADPEHCGTTVEAVFYKRHIDFTPLGDVVSSIVSLVQGNPDTDFVYLHETPEKTASLDTRELRAVLGPEVSLAEYEVLNWIADSLREQEDAP